MLWSLMEPVENLSFVIFVGLIIAIASSTQDITVDALRIEQVGENENKAMAAGAAMAVVGWLTGYKLGGVISLSSAEIFQNLFATEMLRTYLNRDIRGVELGGSMKNVIAIAAGICDGIGYGDNSKAALMTRGMMEITRLGEAMGARVKTFRGLSGYGDLIVTCLSKHSRNRQLGQLIGEGKILEEITSDMSMIAEGIFTAKSVHQLQLKHNVEMPIHEAIYQVLFQKKDPKNSVAELMTRRLSEELN
mgnify:CR=1 FL=1